MVSPPITSLDWAPTASSGDWYKGGGRRLTRSVSKNESQWSFAGMSEQAKASNAKPATQAAAFRRNRSQWAVHGFGPEAGLEKQWQNMQRSASAQSPASAVKRSVSATNSREGANGLKRNLSFQPPPRRDAAVAGDAKGRTAAVQTSPLAAEGMSRSAEIAAKLAAGAAARKEESAGAKAPTPKPLPVQSQLLARSPSTGSMDHERGQSSSRSMSGRRPSTSPAPNSSWLGPPKPLRATNRTLHRGTQALPSGRMHLEAGAFSREYGRGDASSDRGASPARLSRAASNEKLFGRGSQVIPSGPMLIEGTSHDDYGSMYRKRP